MAHFTRKEFKKLCHDEILPKLDELESSRKKIYSSSVFILISAVITFFIMDFYSISSDVQEMSILIIFGPLVIFFIVVPYLGFKKKYKRKIIKFAVEKAFPGYSYRSDCAFSIEQFNSSKLFSTRSNKFSSEDEISGCIDKTLFKMCEVDASKVTGSGKSKRTYQIFNGLILKLDFNKNFSEHTIIRPDIAENYFGKVLGTKLQKISSIASNLKPVKLENPSFEKHFAVYSEDQVEARYLLSPKLMERLLLTRRRLRSNISLSFYKNHLHIAIPQKGNLFEPTLFKSLYDFSELKKMYLVIDFIDDIIHELDLNTRIWSKE